MKLIHYSDKHLTEMYDRDPVGIKMHIGKPGGLWVSVEGENDWPTWCEAEGFGLDRLACPTEVVLAANANVLIIDGPQPMEEFHSTFSTYPYYASTPSERLAIGRSMIDWRRVGEVFDGIIISIYQWHFRLNDEMTWYYSWDCASGCIWRARAVQELRPLPVREVKVEA